MNPLVSIGLPVFNGEHGLRLILDSLVDQSFKDYEVIISNNNSTDSTGEILLDYKHVPNFYFFDQPNQLLAKANFNFVLEKAKGKYFVWVAHDDFWHKDFLKLSVDKFKLVDKDTKFVSPNFWIGNFDQGLGASSLAHPLQFINHEQKEYRFLAALSMHHSLHKCNLVYALFDREFLFNLVQQVSIENDGVFISIACLKARGATIDDLLFFKNYKGNDLMGLTYVKKSNLTVNLHYLNFNYRRHLNDSKKLVLELVDEYHEEIAKIYKQYSKIYNR